MARPATDNEADLALVYLCSANNTRTRITRKKTLRNRDKTIKDLIDNVFWIIDNFLYFCHDYLIVVTLALSVRPATLQQNVLDPTLQRGREPSEKLHVCCRFSAG